MNKHLLTVFLILGLSLSSCTPKSEGFIIKRGTNISHWLSQSTSSREDRLAFFTEKDVSNIASFGFDHIRIPVDEIQLWDDNGNKLDEAWQLLSNALDWCAKYNLRAIVDLHTIRSHHFNASNSGAKNTLFDNPAEQDKLIQMWEELSDHLHNYSTDYVAYEFMNEPVADDPEQWNVIIEKVHKALRAKEPKRVLVIGSNMWQSPENFVDLRIPQNDPYIILSFHFYSPMLLTHYKASWNEHKDYKGSVSYPGVMVSPAEYDSLDDVSKKIAKDFTTVWNKERMHNMISPAIEFAKSQNLQLFCGEWGVLNSAPRQAAYAWYKDMLSIFDEFDIAWTTWDYRGGYGFWKRNEADFADKPLLDILMSGKPLNKQ